jgi:hypothetical protein
LTWWILDGGPQTHVRVLAEPERACTSEAGFKV